MSFLSWLHMLTSILDILYVGNDEKPPHQPHSGNYKCEFYIGSHISHVALQI